MKPARIVFPGFWFGESELAEAKAQAARGVGGFCVYGGTAEQIKELVALFDFECTPYLARPNPKHLPKYSDYEHLARVKEWSTEESDD